MWFGVLGPLVVRVAAGAGSGVEISGPRPRALLVLLLLEAGRVVPVERLVDGQYGDDPPANAANAVQVQVSRLRRVLPDGLIEFHGGGYRIAVDPDDVDVHRFERLAQEGRKSLAKGNTAEAADRLREALDLWRGPALIDLPHGRAQTARLDELRLTATEDLVDADPDAVPIAELRTLVDAHPLRERLRAQLMRALHADNRQGEALQEFASARRLLAEELGADPSPELSALNQAILRAEKPAKRRPAAQLTSFIGRDRELARLRATDRLTTVLGPGGTGKTRLAIESARPGACFVDLSTVDTGDQVPHAVIDALGLREQGFRSPAADPVRHLVGVLGDEQLILDNCEHVVDATAALVRVLVAECPDLTIVCTSREPLGLTGEVLLPLPPLDIPEPGDPNAASYSTVRLFLDRAAAVRPGLTLDIPTVARVCAGLDGLPLAIELAAARLRQFTLDEIAARLVEGGRFRLLSRGDRTAAARHRTLRGVVEWSWDLLTAEERLLAQRFAVFTGGAPLSAVEPVCGVPVEVLADLVDKSLVETDGSRYRMLDTIRLFCLEQLAAAGELESTRAGHARYHLDLAQRADVHLRRAEQLEWLALLSAEHGNLMAALRWASSSDRETALRMVPALAAYWWLSGRRSHAGEIATSLLVDVPDGFTEEYVSCVVHAVPRAEPAHWERADRLVRVSIKPLRHPFGAALWAMAAGPSGQLERDTSPLLGDDPWNLALEQLGGALLLTLTGRIAEGERELLDVLARFRALGERWGVVQALDSLAQVAGWRGEWARAHALWAEALVLLDELGALEDSADTLCHRADCLLRQGELDAAERDYRRAGELRATAGHIGVVVVVEVGLAEIAQARGEPDTARLERAWAAAQSGDFGTESARSRVLTALGHHYQAVAEARESPMMVDLAAAVEGLACVVETDAVALLLGVAVALRGIAVTGALNVARAYERIGEEVSEYARGAAMTREEALTVVDRYCKPAEGER
ncbi:BTAD domain-containing putative transcriptional regulator [Actinokineospora sp. NBRC 105648]|uniref:BTAD domain-containing putative transcriptional regulator n=1 Tax=Actinokineospora sp. NBRC 105648 TaxID=3032206 RepID=UPI0024A3B20D|nr:BTAD domain-containing putative transcriptional regulator [Actinokineospora sp. NBRC 105648]GLZ41114.1 SARP family transcriptional regulator [Actinokineospora sp. NBRC 105648]